jgi:hypothetical protein
MEMTTMQQAMKGADLKAINLRAANEAIKGWPRFNKRYPKQGRPVEIKTGEEARPKAN